MSHTAIPYFLYSAGIVLREGTEALLVVIALVAGTREAGNSSRAREIYFGATLAVIASIIMAWKVNSLITDDASDTLEGVFQLLAAATLFYVSSWLTSKSQSDRWMHFIRNKVQGANESAVPGLALASTAFLAVIREGAETIVFFQALTAGTTELAERHAVMAGVGVASVGLVILFMVLRGAAIKIPLGKFFFATSILLYGLAVIFVGQGIASFQEADVVRATFVDYVPTIPMLGLYPTLQSIGAQAALMMLAAAAIVIPHGSVRRSKGAPELEVSARHPTIRPT